MANKIDYKELAKYLNGLREKKDTALRDFCVALKEAYDLFKLHNQNFLDWAEKHIHTRKGPGTFLRRNTISSYVAMGRLDDEAWAKFNYRGQVRLERLSDLTQALTQDKYTKTSVETQAKYLWHLWKKSNLEARILFMSYIREDEQMKSKLQSEVVSKFMVYPQRVAAP